MTDFSKKIKALGINPPADDHDLELTYYELVRNIVAQGDEDERDVSQEDVDKAMEYFAAFGEPTGEPVTLQVEG